MLGCCAGINIRAAEKCIVIEMTVDGVARLTRSQQFVSSGKEDTTLGSHFLEELIRIARYARRTSSPA